MCNYLGICALVAIFLCYFKRMFEIEPKRFGGITILNQIAHLKINEYTYNRKGSLILLCKMTRMVRRGLTTGTTQKHLGVKLNIQMVVYLHCINQIDKTCNLTHLQNLSQSSPPLSSSISLSPTDDHRVVQHTPFHL